MSRPAIDFFFDFSSPYSYIVAERIEALAARHGRGVSWKPVLLGVLFREVGSAPLTDLHPWKAGYSRMDFARSARFHGLPYRHPSRFPQVTVNAARALLWLQHTGDTRAVPFALEVFRELFVRDGDLSDPATVARVGVSLGIDPVSLLDGANSPEVRAALRARNDEAARLEVFGAPMLVVDGERFWGADRLAMVEARLAETGGTGEDGHLPASRRASVAPRGIRALLDEAAARVRTLTPAEARTLHGDPQTVFVDLRDPRELEREGTIPGAVHAPRGMLEFWVDPDSPYYRDVFVPEKRYVLYCQSGWRSALAAATLADMGLLPDVAHVDGGYRAWKDGGGPWVEKPVRGAGPGSSRA